MTASVTRLVLSRYLNVTGTSTCGQCGGSFVSKEL